MFTRLLLCFGVLILLYGCSEPQNQKRFAKDTDQTTTSTTSTEKSDLEAGKVHAKVKIEQDTVQNYALYLPTSYDGSEAMPLVICCWSDTTHQDKAKK